VDVLIGEVPVRIFITNEETPTEGRGFFQALRFFKEEQESMIYSA
jgi:hypothetical protein